jgi:hypothetical protein
MATQKRVRIPKVIKPGDVITGIGHNGWFPGVVKTVESIQLYRNSAHTPRYHLTDGDVKWQLDHRDVRQHQSTRLTTDGEVKLQDVRDVLQEIEW